MDVTGWYGTKSVIALLIAAGLGGCTALPADGPLGSTFGKSATAAQTVALNDALIDFALVDLSGDVLREIPVHGPARLTRSFGLGKGAPPVTKIVIGDTIMVTIFESAEGGLFLTEGQVGRTGNFVQIPAQMVDSSGSIYVPFAGNIKVVGRTLSQLSSEIERKLQQRAIEPKVVVSIQSREDNRVSVLGEVGSPSQVPININGDRVLDVISKAGGIKHPGYESYVKITRGGHSESVYFNSIVENARENIYVRPRDTVYVYREPQSFVALGAFGSISQSAESKRIPFESETVSLAEAVGKSGGLNDVRADPRQVFVYRLEERSTLQRMGVDLSKFQSDVTIIPTVYRANFRDPSMMFGAQLFRMRDKDVMYAANSGSVELSKFLGLIRDVSGTALVTGGAVSLIAN